ncbi:hypothetical protein G5C60_21410 [Streptomyces sp. HC44]|uniref:Type ISP restriction-modification enzyme LLaBIII C-terminal specificity domain-containing protein n=2 Tax=Streptomyces scabichelini TaxID=2711217 RepID=A0A6G4V7N8_9ACTN|nr:hypothetical protein [Streptomyces scabichelini]
MPDAIRFDEANHQIHVGGGVIGPVSPEMWNYRIGGTQVVVRWFSFRKRVPDVEWQTPLNDIVQETWPAEYTWQLLDLLNVLGLLVALEPDQERLLTAVAEGDLITMTDLQAAQVVPVPPSATKPPQVPKPSRPIPRGSGSQETLDFEA